MIFLTFSRSDGWVITLEARMLLLALRREHRESLVVQGMTPCLLGDGGSPPYLRLEATRDISIKTLQEIARRFQPYLCVVVTDPKSGTLDLIPYDPTLPRDVHPSFAPNTRCLEELVA